MSVKLVSRIESGDQALSVDGKVGWGKVSIRKNIWKEKKSHFKQFLASMLRMRRILHFGGTKSGGIKNMVLLPRRSKSGGAYATMARARTHLHIEMEMYLLWGIHTTNELKQIGMFYMPATTFVNLIKPRKTLILFFHQQSIYVYYFGSSNLSMSEYTRGLFVDCCH